MIQCHQHCYWDGSRVSNRIWHERKPHRIMNISSDACVNVYSKLASKLKLLSTIVNSHLSTQCWIYNKCLYLTGSILRQGAVYSTVLSYHQNLLHLMPLKTHSKYLFLSALSNIFSSDLVRILFAHICYTRLSLEKFKAAAMLFFSNLV